MLSFHIMTVLEIIDELVVELAGESALWQDEVAGFVISVASEVLGSPEDYGLPPEISRFLAFILPSNVEVEEGEELPPLLAEKLKGLLKVAALRKLKAMEEQGEAQDSAKQGGAA